MQDQYTGEAGTFIIDTEKGCRVPIEDYEREQAAKSAGNGKSGQTKTDKSSQKSTNEVI